MRGAALGLKFLLELAMLAAYAATAIALLGWLSGSIAAVVAVAVVGTVWGLWCAPRARRRLATPGRIPLELVLLAGGAVALATWAPVLGAVDAGLIALDAILLTAFRAWDG
jgi:hypothetical protein